MTPALFLALSIITNPAISAPTQAEMNNDPVGTIAQLSVQFCYFKNDQQLTPAYEACVAEQQAATVEFFTTAKTILDAGGDPLPALTNCLNANTIEGIALDTTAVRDCFYSEIGALKGTF